MQSWGIWPGYSIRFPLGAILLAIAAIIPGLLVRFSGVEVPAAIAALLFGLAVVGAAFLASWAAEIVQLDVSGGLAVALLALIAVLPEYAVDFVFTWKAGHDPSQAGNVLANMTGGNQLLLGVGWPLAILLAVRRWRRNPAFAPPSLEVHLHPLQRIEVACLALAALYGLTLTLHTRLGLVDAAVLLGLYAFYLSRLLRAPADEPHLVGPAAVVGALPTRRRRLLNVALFIIAATTIVMVADPFATSLVEVGRASGIPEFFLVKWLAPLASESPELLVAGLFAWKLAPAISIAVLLSAQVNQWTLLVGSLPIVHAFSAGSPEGLPLSSGQRQEVLVTAAFAAVGVAMAARGGLGRKAAVLIFALYLAQLGDSIYAAFVTAGGPPPLSRTGIGLGLLAIAVSLWLRHRRQVARALADGLVKPVEQLALAK